ncbi:MAG: hypothetical protein KAH32_05955 [Chlamydiia bacterium]|nr:hypothetical protein [Chlamydiia bacterium]
MLNLIIITAIASTIVASSFFTKEALKGLFINYINNMNLHLITLLVSVSIFIVILYFYYIAVDINGVTSTVAINLWTAVNYSLGSILLSTSLFFYSFIKA